MQTASAINVSVTKVALRARGKHFHGSSAYQLQCFIWKTEMWECWVIPAQSDVAGSRNHTGLNNRMPSLKGYGWKLSAWSGQLGTDGKFLTFLVPSLLWLFCAGVYCTSQESGCQPSHQGSMLGHSVGSTLFYAYRRLHARLGWKGP